MPGGTELPEPFAVDLLDADAPLLHRVEGLGSADDTTDGADGIGDDMGLVVEL